MINIQDIQRDVTTFVLKSVPHKKSSTMRHKIMMKNDYVKADGTQSLYLEIAKGNKRVRVALNISIEKSKWDSNKQIVKRNHKEHKDLNLILNNEKAKVNQILVNYRLSNLTPTVVDVVAAYNNPTAQVCLNTFADMKLIQQKGTFNQSTYNAHKSYLKKLRRFQDPIWFNTIDIDWIDNYKRWLKVNEGNSYNTIQSNLKNLKKYLFLANKSHIYMPIHPSDVKMTGFKSRIIFLTKGELNTLNDYYNSKFINQNHKSALQRFLFSCFTGLRRQDIFNLTQDNFIGEYLAFTASKPPSPFIKIKMPKSASNYYELPHVFEGDYHIEKWNATLKEIAKICGITKRISMHVARHTFATQYLINGGNVAKLQKVLGHANIKMTMNYVHIVDGIMDEDIMNLDNILNIDTN